MEELIEVILQRDNAVLLLVILLGYLIVRSLSETTRQNQQLATQLMRMHTTELGTINTNLTTINTGLETNTETVTSTAQVLSDTAKIQSDIFNQITKIDKAREADTVRFTAWLQQYESNQVLRFDEQSKNLKALRGEVDKFPDSLNDLQKGVDASNSALGKVRTQQLATKAEITELKGELLKAIADADSTEALEGLLSMLNEIRGDVRRILDRPLIDAKGLISMVGMPHAKTKTTLAQQIVKADTPSDLQE